jgi:hypothetical protein
MFTNEEQARYAVELSEALERLEQNADFKRVIKDAYLDESVKGIVMTLAYSNENQLKDRLNKLIGISNLQLFLVSVKANGARAHEALNDPSVFEQGE